MGKWKKLVQIMLTLALLGISFPVAAYANEEPFALPDLTREEIDHRLAAGRDSIYNTVFNAIKELESGEYGDLSKDEVIGTALIIAIGASVSCIFSDDELGWDVANESTP